ncbi:MAG: hypothetical protein MJZ37_08855 [Bacilli bacterium]|nr:hypothetical protein [Bacilli bacterium]
MITRYYYTMNELSDIYATGGFNKLFVMWGSQYTDDQYTNSLFSDVQLSYGDDFIMYIDVYHPMWEPVEKPTVQQILSDYPQYKKEFVKQINKIKHWLDESKYRYEKLINLYEDNANKLMDKVETISSTQFNDTPQTTVDGLDGDNYATTYTKNKSASDLSTVMSRLDEIRRAWRSMYEEWSNEFGSTFVIYND